MEWNKMVPELTVSRIKESLVFYTEVLGFKIVHQRENPSFAYLDLDGAQLMLEEFHEGGWNVGELEKPFGRGVNLQIEVDDLQKVLDGVRSANLSLFRAMKEAWYSISDEKESGQKEFLVRDPDGFLLRFSQFLGEREKV